MGPELIRKKGWEERFIKAILIEQEAPFEWGKHDCAILMAASVKAIHGEDHPALEEFTKYTDEKSAKRHLAKHGGLVKLIEKYFEPVNILSAQQGDIGVVEAEGFASGAVIVDGIALGKSQEGVFRVPIKQLTKVYRV